ncbi:hypothetical protein T05_2938 [Trichinella murrelli]|uniref:Uncharacterized protein n=1 Tax=Trichinella murrelli TaxID=144512 RepID=A0A0V0SVU0_9BILA|nr:hypothetical protein T05_2938 [Trichinella murrelli]
MGNRLPMTLSISWSQILLVYHVLMENTKLPMLMQMSSKTKGETTRACFSAFPRFR